VRATREGEALAKGFHDTWRDLGLAAPVTVTLKAGEALTKESLQQTLLKVRPAAVVVWDGAEAPATLDLLTALEGSPETAIVSAGYLGEKMWSISDRARGFTYLTYPYRMPPREAYFKQFIETYTKKSKNPDAIENITKKSYITTQMLTQALMDMRGNYYRDNFFDVIGMMKDQLLPLYERLSFGPGQRYASKGCYIVQLGKGPASTELIRKSDWVIH
jgi:hypothetical protein